MEPRPQQPRPSSGQRNPSSGQTPAGGPPPQQPPYQPLPGQEFPQEGYPEGYDPTTVVAAPRTDYDYSPLDLAPPGQRRRRQLIAGAIGALSIILLGAVIVFGWMLLRENDPEDNGEDRVAIATQTAESEDQSGAGDGDETGTPPATAPAATEAPTAPAATEAPTTAPGDANAGAVDQAGLTALLPDNTLLPAGFDEGVDSSRDLTGVVEALGGSRIAEQNLAAWGWTANVERVFTNSTAEAGLTSSITVSLHGFKDAPSAAESLPFYSDILLNLGYYEVDAPQIGESVRLLRQDGEDGGVTVALYVQQGSVMYRFGGYAMGGDPTQDVINLATAVIGGQ